MLRSKNIVITIVILLFAFLFTYTSASNSMHVDDFKTTFPQSSTKGSWPTFLSGWITAVELIAVILVAMPWFRLYGFAFSLSVMITSAGYIFIMIFFSSKLPFYYGEILRELSRQNHLFITMFFAALAAIGFIKKNREVRENLFYTYKR